MLQTLNIQNVALIDKLALNFSDKLNVISGETGAGKSIMLDSLSFVFGGRADKSLIRSGESKMKVEAIFSCLKDGQKKYILEEFGIQVDDELFISRELDCQGKNVCKINGELFPVASLKKLCLSLVDLHGQSEHLAILDNEYQLKIIDNFNPETSKELEILAVLIQKVKEIDKEINLLGGQDKQNLIDLYSYQLQEIQQANIKENEFEDLLDEKKEIQQFEKINNNLSTVLESLNKNNFSAGAVEQTLVAKKNLQNIADISERYKSLGDRLESVSLELVDIADSVQEALRNNVFDQERFDFVDSRLDFLKSLFRKYGGDYEKLKNYKDEIAYKLDLLINGAEKFERLSFERENILKDIDLVQKRLSDIRQNSAKILVEKMEQELKTLGMPNAKMSVEFSRIEERYSLLGYDKVELMFCSNLGFELKPLSKVVSGGEMSRVMLAYKIIVAGIDNIGTIIFDEIDTGLSGKIATVVAEYMARLSENKQIIAVSHLPQICAMADENIKVTKYSIDNTTKTGVEILRNQNLYEEISRLMGVQINSEGINVAKELKIVSENYKKSIKNQ